MSRDIETWLLWVFNLPFPFSELQCGRFLITIVAVISDFILNSNYHIVTHWKRNNQIIVKKKYIFLISLQSMIVLSRHSTFSNHLIHFNSQRFMVSLTCLIHFIVINYWLSVLIRYDLLILFFFQIDDQSFDTWCIWKNMRRIKNLWIY